MLVQVQQFRTGTRYGLEILCQCGKRFKLKVGKFWRLIPTFVDIIGEKLVEGGGFLPPPPPILNRVKYHFMCKA